MSVKFSEGEAALVNAARGDRPRGAWLRDAALAALGIPVSRNAVPLSIDGIKIPLVVDDRQPPGIVTLASAWRDEQGDLQVSAASMKVAPEEPPEPRRKPCKHPKVHGKGTCPDCFEWVPSK
jgi:hypothetical protein